MKTQNYSCRISAKVTASEAFDAINRVSEWWATDFEGSTQDLSDMFTVYFDDTSVNFKVVELIPDKRIGWFVTDCYLPWLHDKKEWKGTMLLWEILTEKETAIINFTHIGLVPEIECFEDCREGWDFHIGESLFKLITEQKGIPNIDTRKASRQ